MSPQRTTVVLMLYCTLLTAGVCSYFSTRHISSLRKELCDVSQLVDKKTGELNAQQRAYGALAQEFRKGITANDSRAEMLDKKEGLLQQKINGIATLDSFFLEKAQKRYEEYYQQLSQEIYVANRSLFNEARVNGHGDVMKQALDDMILAYINLPEQNEDELISHMQVMVEVRPDLRTFYERRAVHMSALLD
tara:strand:+ start:2009 stop:2584 length:576 start_codon:yes stop_codon:yes gene_type:complete